MNLIENDRDYDSGPFNATFDAGETLAIVNILINDDNVVEYDENFTIFIDPSALPIDVTTANPSTTTVTIFDDDCE